MPKVKKNQIVYCSLLFVLMVCWLGSRSPEETSNQDDSSINSQYLPTSQDDDVASRTRRSAEPRIFESSKKSLSSGGGRRRHQQPKDDPACGYYQVIQFFCIALFIILLNITMTISELPDLETGFDQRPLYTS